MEPKILFGRVVKGIPPKFRNIFCQEKSRKISCQALSPNFRAEKKVSETRPNYLRSTDAGLLCRYGDSAARTRRDSHPPQSPAGAGVTSHVQHQVLVRVRSRPLA